MSDEGKELSLTTEDGQVLTAEYFKDGQLQIVEVTPFDKSGESSMMEFSADDTDETKYLQVLDTGKNLVHLDLLNITLVKCDDDENSYQVVGTSSEENGETTITCVLSSDDTEEMPSEEQQDENQDSFVVVNSVEGEDPLVYLQSTLQQIHTQQALRKDKHMKKPLTPAEILKKAKALQKAKALLKPTAEGGRGRRLRPLPSPLEIITSPNFKLYLYSCKLCSYKCNAIKEMTAHKASKHAGRSMRGTTLQCARCPHRASTYAQLMLHIQEKHDTYDSVTGAELGVSASGDVDTADVLVCGACGFESGDRLTFKTHIEERHSIDSGNKH